MFSMLPIHPHTYGQSNLNYYTPNKRSPLSSSPLRNTTPSPLSPRNMNVPARTPGHGQEEDQDAVMSSPSKQSPTTRVSQTIFTTTPESTRQSRNNHNRTNASANTLPSPPPSKRESTYSKRATKPNPLFNGGGGRGYGSGDEGRETRRKLFLKRVRQGSEDKRWSARGGDEEIMRCLYVAEQRRVEERLRREAVGFKVEEEGEEDWEMLQQEELLMEELELDAMLSSLDPEQGSFDHSSGASSQMGGMFGEMGTSNQNYQEMPMDQQSIYGSDDDEYDQVFMEVIQQESRVSSQQQPPGYVQDEDMMDMS
ncbi:hypothetical protein VTL71DRAFT_10489 [Oculimacula yallundae]|uniref:Uncharacterized protein n=1 Tax=Oculimacula yallundae TaxID=86028 RepID=A0ABR4CTI6_9HELO